MNKIKGFKINEDNIARYLNDNYVFENAFVALFLTDEFLLDDWINADIIKDKEKKLLEIRIFNRNKEFKAFRSDVSKDFICRLIDDDSCVKEYFDEKQYLDIDVKRSKETFKNNRMVITQGGGTYRIPAGADSGRTDTDLDNTIRYCLTVRSYVGNYENTGKAIVDDWRLVDIERKC